MSLGCSITLSVDGLQCRRSVQERTVELQSEEPKTGGADLWSGIRSKYLADLNEDQKLRIFDLTTRVSREFHRWAARYPLIRKVRVWPVCLSVAAGAPFASASALTSMARMGLWIFTVDDLFDEEMVPYPEFQRRITRYHDILAGGRLDPQSERDTLALALHNIREDLRRIRYLNHYRMSGRKLSHERWKR